MSPRRIVDETGTTWELWEVDPAQVQLWETHATAMRLPATEDTALPAPVSGEFRGGWLAARNGQERRRIAPVPTDWLFMADSQLRQLIERADPRPDVDLRRLTERVIDRSQLDPRSHVRAFADEAGNRWDAWEVHPALEDRRAAADRRAKARPSPERRTRALTGYSRGWLVFRSGMLRHRLHTVPDQWFELNDDDLRILLVNATLPRQTQQWRA